MQVVTPELVQGKKVLLRMDLDVPLQSGRILDDYRLEEGFPTLEMCLENAQEVVVMGHIGRPEGQEVNELSVAPIHDWLEDRLGPDYLESGKLKLLENLRFEPGEDQASPEFAKELANFGNFFINEAFASHHPAASTTVLPTLLPHACGLHFAKEVEMLTRIRSNPTHPLVVVVGGAKVEDKLPVALALSSVAEAVLVGGKVAGELKDQGTNLPSNVLAGQLNEERTDIAPSTILAWEKMISGAKMIVWNGPLGLIEGQGEKVKGTGWGVEGLGSAGGTYQIAQMIIKSGAESIIGGGDTIDVLRNWGLLDRFSFVSTGGGAMLKFLTEGTLPTIRALE